jgi:hypothetical protein
MITRLPTVPDCKLRPNAPVPGFARVARLGLLLAGLVFQGFAVRAMAADSSTAASPAAASASAPGPGASAAQPQRAGAARPAPTNHHQQKMTGRAGLYYTSAWGVDKLKVSSTMSGNLIRFSWRVTDPEKARILNDKRSTPALEAPRSNAVLQVPVMDKVGMLRQAPVPVVGQEYWMVFSNKGNLVRPGDRVNVVIGNFHADGLMVE